LAGEAVAQGDGHHRFVAVLQRLFAHLHAQPVDELCEGFAHFGPEDLGEVRLVDTEEPCCAFQRNRFPIVLVDVSYRPAHVQVSRESGNGPVRVFLNAAEKPHEKVHAGVELAAGQGADDEDTPAVISGINGHYGELRFGTWAKGVLKGPVESVPALHAPHGLGTDNPQCVRSQGAGKLIPSVGQDMTAQGEGRDGQRRTRRESIDCVLDMPADRPVCPHAARLQSI